MGASSELRLRQWCTYSRRRGEIEVSKRWDLRCRKGQLLIVNE